MADFFAAGSPYLAHPLLTAERSELEAARLAEALSLAPGASVLDVGCGFGRHAVALAVLGHRTVGIDSSATMIEAAEAAAIRAEVDTTEFHCLAGEDLADVDEFDGALCMFTSLGQSRPGEAADNRSMLANVARALRPGGRLAVEVPIRDRAVAALVEAETFGEGDNRTEVSRRFDPGSARMIEQFRVFADGRESPFDLAYTLFSPEELIDLLEAHGFRPLALRSDLDALIRAVGSRAGQATGAGDLIDLAPDSLFMIALADVR